jgi:hypothetical protein
VAKSAGELGDEYRFDYAEAKPNRFASHVDQTRLVVTLDADVSVVFSTPAAVNKALRSLIAAMPTQVSPNKAPIRSRRKQGA